MADDLEMVRARSSRKLVKFDLDFDKLLFSFFFCSGRNWKVEEKKMCHLHICRELEEGEGEGAGPAVVAPLLTGHTWKSRKIPRNAPALWPISATIVSDFFFLESPSEWVGWVGDWWLVLVLCLWWLCLVGLVGGCGACWAVAVVPGGVGCLAVVVCRPAPAQVNRGRTDARGQTPDAPTRMVA